MGFNPFKAIKKVVKKVTGAVKKVVKGVAKGVKKVVKGVGKVIKKVGKGVKKLAKNKIVRAALMITAAVMLPGAIAAIGPAFATTTLANAAVTGAIMGGGGALLAGGDLKDVLKGAALGSATGAAFRGIANKVNQLGAQPAVDAGTTTVEAATGDVVVGASDDIVLGASEDIVSSQVASPLDVSADISSTVADTAASSQGLIEEMVVYGQPTPAPSVADYATPITVASADLQIDPKPAPIVTEPPSYLERIGTAAKDKITQAVSPESIVNYGSNVLLGAAETAIAQRLQGDPENIGAYGARPETIGASLLEQFQVAYQEAGININDAYKNMTYGSGDINAIQNELFRQETLRIA